jgi:hypothetical protein
VQAVRWGVVLQVQVAEDADAHGRMGGRD